MATDSLTGNLFAEVESQSSATTERTRDRLLHPASDSLHAGYPQAPLGVGHIAEPAVRRPNHARGGRMVQALENLTVADGDPVTTEHIAIALTAGRLVYDDGATQTFEPGGSTTYVERQQRSHGEWHVDDEGRFCSFWPPSYRACYELQWIVENRSVVGLRFIELDRGSVFVGRYG